MGVLLSTLLELEVGCTFREPASLCLRQAHRLTSGCRRHSCKREGAVHASSQNLHTPVREEVPSPPPSVQLHPLHGNTDGCQVLQSRTLVCTSVARSPVHHLVDTGETPWAAGDPAGILQDSISSSALGVAALPGDLPCSRSQARALEEPLVPPACEGKCSKVSAFWHLANAAVPRAWQLGGTCGLKIRLCVCSGL